MGQHQPLIKDGIRNDGRGPNDLRPISITAGLLKRADGSCYLEWGNNKVFAAVYGPKELQPRYLQNPHKAVLQASYTMASFSVGDRKRPGPDRRSIEISKLTSEALSSVVILEMYPRTSIDVHIEVVEADAGTRCAGIVAASVALADAGIAMRDLIGACATGMIDGTLVLDLNKEEDNRGSADVPLAIIPSTGEVALLQMDGRLTSEELEQAISMSAEAIRKHIHPMQVRSLKEQYSAISGDDVFEDYYSHSREEA